MTVGMEEHQIGQLVILVMAIPVMQFEALLGLHQLSTNGTPSVLPGQDCGAKCRRRLQRQVPIAVLEVRLPVGIEWVGVALDLDIALRFDRLPNADDLCTGDRIGEPPGFPWLMGKVALYDPAPGFVRVVSFGPSIEPSPHEGVELGKRLATDAMAVIVRPAPQDGVQGVDEPCRGTPRGLLTEGFDPGGECLETDLARRDLQLGRFAVGPLIFA